MFWDFSGSRVKFSCISLEMRGMLFCLFLIALSEGFPIGRPAMLLDEFPDYQLGVRYDEYPVSSVIYWKYFLTVIGRVTFQFFIFNLKRWLSGQVHVVWLKLGRQGVNLLQIFFVFIYFLAQDYKKKYFLSWADTNEDQNDIIRIYFLPGIKTVIRDHTY